LVNTVHIDGKRVWNYKNFSTFIKSVLGISSDELLNEEYSDNTEIDLNTVSE
jgi:hypothetical protein